MENTITFDASKKTLYCQGRWELANLPMLKDKLEKVTWPSGGKVMINASKITDMDTAGAWLLQDWINILSKKGVTVQFEALTDKQQTLLGLVKKRLVEEKKLPAITVPFWLTRLGHDVCLQLQDFQAYLAFIGKMSLELLRIFSSPKHIRINELAGAIYKTGYTALPIIALLSFMIGVVLTYQMGLQLRNYGANIFIVDLLGLSVLREFGPLITAIMVAGRTGSAFTAQLGIMKINQEIDALDTMGVTPGELLLIPRIIGLMIALPLLTIWADIFGVFGGMIMSNSMLGITWENFLSRFQHEIPLRALIIGLGKAPVFALIIGSIGCFQGMKVQGSADSIGKNTTRSVVLGIFFIIVADALFSIIFSKLKL